MEIYLICFIHNGDQVINSCRAVPCWPASYPLKTITSTQMYSIKYLAESQSKTKKKEGELNKIEKQSSVKCGEKRRRNCWHSFFCCNYSYSIQWARWRSNALKRVERISTNRAIMLSGVTGKWRQQTTGAFINVSLHPFLHPLSISVSRMTLTPPLCDVGSPVNMFSNLKCVLHLFQSSHNITTYGKL